MNTKDDKCIVGGPKEREKTDAEQSICWGKDMKISYTKCFTCTKLQNYTVPACAAQRVTISDKKTLASFSSLGCHVQKIRVTTSRLLLVLIDTVFIHVVHVIVFSLSALPTRGTTTFLPSSLTFRLSNVKTDTISRYELC
jgi:hypothetical protein